MLRCWSLRGRICITAARKERSKLVFCDWLYKETEASRLFIVYKGRKKHENWKLRFFFNPQFPYRKKYLRSPNQLCLQSAVFIGKNSAFFLHILGNPQFSEGKIFYIPLSLFSCNPQFPLGNILCVAFPALTKIKDKLSGEKLVNKNVFLGEIVSKQIKSNFKVKMLQKENYGLFLQENSRLQSLISYLCMQGKVYSFERNRFKREAAMNFSLFLETDESIIHTG